MNDVFIQDKLQSICDFENIFIGYPRVSQNDIESLNITMSDLYEETKKTLKKMGNVAIIINKDKKITTLISHKYVLIIPIIIRKCVMSLFPDIITYLFIKPENKSICTNLFITSI